MMSLIYLPKCLWASITEESWWLVVEFKEKQYSHFLAFSELNILQGRQVH